MPFTESVTIVSENVIAKLIIPDFMFDISPIQSFRKIKIAFDETTSYMKELIDNKVTSSNEHRKDILSLLLKSKDESKIHGNQKVLTDQEILADIFMFLIAGHESTAHTLTFALRYLALYPEIQEEFHKNTISLIGDKIPCFDDINKLEMALHIFNETLRLCPVSTIIPKVSTVDINFGSCIFPKDRIINVDVYNLHRNPEYWKNPNKFDPSRWARNEDIGVNNPYCFVPFSQGKRRCMGKKFAITEAVVFLTMISQRYKWKFLSSKDRDDEKLFAWNTMVTMHPLNNIKLLVEKR
jgi:cytochrome P450